MGKKPSEFHKVFGFKCQVSRELSYPTQVMEVIVPVVIARGNERIRERLN